MGEMRRRFTKEYKIEAVRLATVGDKSLAQVARELGLRPDVLREWKRHFSAAPSPAEAFRITARGRSRAGVAAAASRGGAAEAGEGFPKKRQ